MSEVSGPLVALEPWEYQWASHVGIARYTQNWPKQDAAWYEKSRMEDDRTAQVAGAVAELAVAKFTNRYWSGTMWTTDSHGANRDRPDVGRNIEVKRVRTRDAAVRRHQVGKGLVLWVARPIPPEFRQVEMWGWLPVDEAWELGVPADYDKSGQTRVVARRHLRLDF